MNRNIFDILTLCKRKMPISLLASYGLNGMSHIIDYFFHRIDIYMSRKVGASSCKGMKMLKVITTA